MQGMGRMFIRARLVFNAGVPQPSQNESLENVRIKVALNGCNKASTQAAMKVASNGRHKNVTQNGFDKRQVLNHPARVAKRFDPTIAVVKQMWLGAVINHN